MNPVLRMRIRCRPRGVASSTLRVELPAWPLLEVGTGAQAFRGDCSALRGVRRSVLLPGPLHMSYRSAGQAIAAGRAGDDPTRGVRPDSCHRQGKHGRPVAPMTRGTMVSPVWAYAPAVNETVFIRRGVSLQAVQLACG